MPSSPRNPKFNFTPLLAALAAAGAVALFFLTRQSEPSAPEGAAPVPEATAEPTPEPTPAPEPTATPEPTPEETPPEPEPDPADSEATPSLPTEDELLGPLPTQEEDEDISTIPTLAEPIPFNVPPPPRLQASAVAQQPNRWPSRVQLRKTVAFPVVINGRNAGSVQVPAKTPVTLRRVYPDGRLEIGYHQSVTVVPASSTDFLLRVKPGSAPSHPAAAQRRQIVTFPDTVLNSTLAPEGAAPAPTREIPIE